MNENECGCVDGCPECFTPHPPSGRCDFCQINEAKHTINGGLWWICTPCLNDHYGRWECEEE